ncbi:helix-turn-helix domain-containing protein [Nonomuraea sp. MTCD27]|uniref:helix-turn-helix domain-containing protein n=1 Tax=Nonomuraea sp. MTCD27 TaxID=1676747 RepID=UPI0035C08E5D
MAFGVDEHRPAGTARLDVRHGGTEPRELLRGGLDVPEAGALVSPAGLLGVSPFQLSRAFTRELGVSLTHHRNRVRVGRALDRLELGEPSLAVLAADLGFADQAHLTRTIRRHVCHTPTALRRLLTARNAGPSGFSPTRRHKLPQCVI